MTALPRLFFFLSFALASEVASGGSIRYELSSLLGEHRYNGNDRLTIDSLAFIDTPFGFYAVTEARLVVEGQVVGGKARGDGVLREAVEFDLAPLVSAQPSFSTSAEFRLEPTPESFRLERVFENPFVPNTIPLPGPVERPPVSFYVGLSVRPAFNTDLPKLITTPSPGELVLSTEGVVIDRPIVAQITDAYIVLSGPTIVPEPSAVAMLTLAASAWAWRRRR